MANTRKQVDHFVVNTNDIDANSVTFTSQL